MKTNYREQEPDLDSIAETHEDARRIREEDMAEAKKLGMTIEEFYRERDEMKDDSWMEESAKTGLW